MPSMRRMRLLMAAAIVTVVLILFYTSGREPEHDIQLKDFYQKTKDAIDRGTSRGQTVINTKTGQKAGHIPADKDGDGDIDEDDKHAGEELQQRLQAVAQEAKDKANEKGGLKPDTPSKIVGVGSSADGQDKKGVKAAEAPFPTEKDKPIPKEQPKETEEQHQAEVELNSILKKSPVIIFSKTYCPHSKRVKGVLLEKYAITPDPYIVELDEHPLGPHLQDYLLAKTGRRTVPNIMVNGISIGGADDVVKLDNDDKLVAKIRDLGQRRVEVSERFAAGAHH
ncbi:Monothiol glutaredoxin-7 [Cladobotryum mycophilum]|uniref:Monothiol glutaredoxin-7 n=1 Tax=Cladobotryum mycophilum TaxID=491253 RepID=A0ABR0S5C0_9HYPO